MACLKQLNSDLLNLILSGVSAPKSAAHEREKSYISRDEELSPSIEALLSLRAASKDCLSIVTLAHCSWEPRISFTENPVTVVERMIRYFPRLVSLSLLRCAEISRDQFIQILTLAQLHLRRLTLSREECPSQIQALLSNAFLVSRLRKLAIRLPDFAVRAHVRVSLASDIFHNLSALTALESLTIDQVELSCALSATVAMRCLTSLRLLGVAVEAPSKNILEIELKNLITFSADDVRVLAGLTCLHTLDIRPDCDTWDLLPPQGEDFDQISIAPGGFGRLTSLTRLQLPKSNVAIPDLRFLTNLRELNFAPDSPYVDMTPLALLCSALTKLDTLSFFGGSVWSESLYRGVCQLPLLTHLEPAGCFEKILDSDIPLPRVLSLRIYFQKSVLSDRVTRLSSLQSFTGSASSALQHLPHLTHLLHLYDRDMDWNPFRSPKYTDLKELGITHSKSTAAFSQLHMIGSCFPNLVSLDFSDVPLLSDEWVSPITQLQHLSRLSLVGTAVRGTGLGGACFANSLRSLKLCENHDYWGTTQGMIPVSEEGVNVLKAFSRVRSLCLNLRVPNRLRPAILTTFFSMPIEKLTIFAFEPAHALPLLLQHGTSLRYLKLFLEQTPSVDMREQLQQRLPRLISIQTSTEN